MAMNFGYVYLNASTQDTWRPEINRARHEFSNMENSQLKDYSNMN